MSSDPREWIAVSMLPGLGPATLAKLTAQGITPAHILASDLPPHLRLRPDTRQALNPQTIQRMLQHADQIMDKAQQLGLECLCLDGDNYPPLLKEISDPPVVLWCQGDSSLLVRPQLAIVGSRKPSPQGSKTAFDFAYSLATSGFVITSGLAQGIDAQAHQGALQAQQCTVAVLGASPEHIYPKRHRYLSEQIKQQGGLLLAEFPPGTTPRPEHFPRRNRIISGLSLGTLVIEAAIRSGSLITARLAMEQGREVYAIPGSIHHPLAKGCHALIREGATLVENQQQIVEPLAPLLGVLAQALPSVKPSKAAEADLSTASTPGHKLFQRLKQAALTLDELHLETGMAVSELQQLLINLQLEGKIDRYGDRYMVISVTP